MLLFCTHGRARRNPNQDGPRTHARTHARTHHARTHAPRTHAPRTTHARPDLSNEGEDHAGRHAERARCRQDSQFFSVGFSSGHDAKLLNSLTKAGTLTGCFFYIPTDRTTARPTRSTNKNALIRQSMSVGLLDAQGRAARAPSCAPSSPCPRSTSSASSSSAQTDGPDHAEAGTPGAHATQPEPAAVADR